jgi:hypothetical protein
MMRVHVAHELVGHEINGKGCRDMKFSNRLVPAALFVLAMVVPTASKAQATTQKTESKTIPSPELEMQKKTCKPTLISCVIRQDGQKKALLSSEETQSDESLRAEFLFEAFPRA